MGADTLKRVLVALAFSISCCISSAANAAVYLFTISGPNTATFALDSSPVPSSTNPVGAGGYFTLTNILGSYNGLPTTFSQMQFYTSGQFDGGLFVNSTINLSGPQLFTGSLANPTFSLGTFTLSDGNPLHAPYLLSITAGAVPEPTTWATMLLGFAGIGWVSRRKQRHMPRAVAAE